MVRPLSSSLKVNALPNPMSSTPSFFLPSAPISLSLGDGPPWTMTLPCDAASNLMREISLRTELSPFDLTPGVPTWTPDSTKLVSGSN